MKFIKSTPKSIPTLNFFVKALRRPRRAVAEVLQRFARLSSGGTSVGIVIELG